MKKLLLIPIIFILCMASVFATNWYSNTTVDSGLSDARPESAPATIMMYGNGSMIAGAGDGSWIAYTWANNAWYLNTTLDDGLIDTGTFSHPTIYYKDIIYQLMTGTPSGLFDLYYWNTSTNTWWVNNSGKVGLVDVGTYSTPHVYYKDNLWHAIVGSADGDFDGYYWNYAGKTWTANASIIGGLLDVGTYSYITTYNTSQGYFAIVGAYNGSLTGYSWDYTAKTWVLNITAKTGLTEVSPDLYSSPTAWYMYDKWNMVIGSDDGPITGFMLNDTFASGSSGTGPSISAIKPANDTFTTDSSIVFNTTVLYGTTAKGIANCSLYGNFSGSWAINNTITSIANNTETVITTLNLNDGSYSWNVRCWDNNTAAPASAWFANNYTLIIDSVSPQIFSSYNLTNNYTYVYYYNDVVGTINGSDDNLYFMNISIDDALVFNVSDINATSYQYNLSYNMSWMTDGLHWLHVDVCDGHTLLDIGDKSVEIIGKNTIAFDGYSVEAVGASKVSYIREKDRISPIVEYDKITLFKEYYIHSDSPIQKVSRPGYKGHFIILEKQAWIDFEDGTIADVTYERIDDYTYKVVVWNPENKITYHSSGTLNCIENTYQIFKVNYTRYVEPVVLVGTDVTFYLNLTYNSTWTNTLNASLHFNGTKYPMTGTISSGVEAFKTSITMPTISSQQNITYYYEYYLGHADLTAYNHSLGLYTITEDIPKMDNCTIYTTLWLNATIRAENNASAITGDMNYIFNFTSGTYTGVYSGSMTNNMTFKFCQYPSWANFTSNVVIAYSKTGYDSREYVQSDMVVDNVTTNLDLYLLESGTASDITVHVVDDEDNNLYNVLIECYKYRVATNDYILVETEYTDYDGNTIFNIEAGTQFYLFKFYQDGILKLETGKFKIFSTTLEYVLQYAPTNWLTGTQDIEGIGNITYDNDTYIVTFTWEDLLNVADWYCFNVSNSSSLVYTNCSFSNNGSMSYTLTNNNLSYYTVGTAHHSLYDRWYNIANLWISPYKLFKNLGDDLSLGLAFILIILVSFLFLISATLAILGGTISITLLYLFGMLPITLGSVIGIICIAVILLYVINKGRYQ